MKRLRLIVTVTACLATLGAFGTVAHLSATKGIAQSPVSRSEMNAAARLAESRIVGGRRIQVRDITGSPQDRGLARVGSRRFLAAGSGDELIVDSRGVVRGYFNNRALQARIPDSSNHPLPALQLATIARSFATSMAPGLDLRSCRQEVARTLVGTDAAGSVDYVTCIRLTQYVGAVPSCNYIDVTIDPGTGAVLTATADSGSLPDTTQPSISKAEAVSAAAKALSMPVASEVTILRIWRNPATHGAVLVWDVSLVTGTPSFGGHGNVIIDAVSGELLQQAM